MKAIETDKNTTTNHSFEIEKDGVKYYATIYLNSKGKFIDERITFFRSGEELGYEGEQGEIREEIVEYLGENWDNVATIE